MLFTISRITLIALVQIFELNRKCYKYSKKSVGGGGSEGNSVYELCNQKLIVWDEEKGLFTSVSESLFPADDFIIPLQ
jgi:hypothetical protein